jgi:hypothetical protein
MRQCSGNILRRLPKKKKVSGDTILQESDAHNLLGSTYFSLKDKP